MEAEIPEKQSETPVDSLIAICGADAVITDEADLRFFAQDLFSSGALPLAILQPDSAKTVSKIIRFCRAEKIAVFPRGGGMSYTDAFQPNQTRSVMLDFSRLSEIRDIAVQDGHVIVETGCTWAMLDEALSKHGLRARFWGPMSGSKATIGGSISQGSVTFGSGTTGASANAVKSFEIVTGTGDIIQTGSDGTQDTAPFNRNFGPDLTGIFANDAGAMGIKTAITLETEPRPAHVGGISFAYDDFNGMADLFNSVLQNRLSGELMAMDADVARQNAGQPDLVADMKAMWTAGKAAGNPLTALNRLFRIAVGGRRFLDKAKYTMHCTVEGRDKADLASKLKAIRKLSKGGNEIVNTVPLMMRAMPFPPLPVTHPDGRRMLPIHGIFPHSALHDFHLEYLELKAGFADDLKEHEVAVAEFFAGVAGIGTLYEPVFYWPDSLSEFHDRMTPKAMQDMPEYSENTAARALVKEIIAAFNVLVHKHGGTHFQIGKLYPHAQNRKKTSAQFLRDVKAVLDPDNIISPGALGL